MRKLLFLGFGLFFLIHSIKAQNSISGYIISLEKAEPIPNATIFLNNQYNLSLENPDSLQVTSDSTGFYKINGIKEDTYVINAWTAYHAMNQRYAMVIASDRIDIDRDLTVDFVFSENAFKYRLHSKFHPNDAIKILNQERRRSDSVALRAVLPQIYVDSKSVPTLTWYIKDIGTVEKN